MKRSLLSLLLLLLTAIITEAHTSGSPKREFRGVWVQTVFRDDYARRSPDENRAWISERLDALRRAGINAVIFQVRPSADAFYNSHHEPSSRFLTGECGVTAGWDPLEFMVEECHKRGMELHAWLNPYRITTSKDEKLPADHIARRHPERTVKFNGRLYFDPSQKENREWIAKVVDDIVAYYDIDAIHFDDYFYPYPVKGTKFNDDARYAATGGGLSLGDWRRKNVDLMIALVSETIKKRKPWVRFGISPFGIWRNSTSDARGSKTRGLQNYDDLYADVILWAREGWIDYLMPQLYWATDHRVAPWSELAEWWDSSVDSNCMVIIGQDVKVTMNAGELHRKITDTRSLSHTDGSCWWPASLIADNHGGIADHLEGNFHASVALPPAYPALSDRTPKPAAHLRCHNGILTWRTDEPRGHADDVSWSVVYLFPGTRDINTQEPEAIHAVTTDNRLTLPEGFRGTAVVTTLSRVNVESRPSVIHIN